jgi:hypothetical protein
MLHKGLSTGSVPIGQRMYVDPCGLRVHRIPSLKQFQVSNIRLKVEYATLWPCGPYSRVIIIPNRNNYGSETR